MAIRAGTARSIVLYMKVGLRVEDAVRKAVEDLRRLKKGGGLLRGVNLHAIDNRGNFAVLSLNAPKQTAYWLWRKGEAKPEKHEPERVAL